MTKPDLDRAILCLWCGCVIVDNIDAIPVWEGIGIIKSHDIVCPKTPLIIKNHALKNNKKRLTREISLN